MLFDGDIGSSFTIIGQNENNAWLKIRFDQLYCINIALEYTQNTDTDNIEQTWTYIGNDSWSCTGIVCEKHIVTVRVVNDNDGSFATMPGPNCSFGNELMIIRTGVKFPVYEFGAFYVSTGDFVRNY